MVVAGQFLAQAIRQRINLNEFINIHRNTLLPEQLRGFQNLGSQCSIGNNGGLCRAFRSIYIIGLFAAPQRRKQLRFTTSCVSNGTGSMSLIQKLFQPVSQLCIVAGRVDRDSDLTEKGRIINALMSFAITGDKAGTIHSKHHIQIHQTYVMNHLVISPLQEGGIDGHNREHSLAGQSGSKGHRVLLCHAHIKETLREMAVEILQPGTIFHGGSNGTDVGTAFRQSFQVLPETGGERGGGGHIRIQCMGRIKGGNTVEFAGILLSGLKAFSLYSDCMDKNRCGLMVQVPEQLSQFDYIVTVHRAKVLEPHLFKHGGVIQAAAQQRLAAL